MSKDRFRAVLVLGKYRVIKKTDTHVQVALGGTTTMTFDIKPFFDIREGDLLTFYTEVYTNAQPSPSSVQ